MSSSHPTLTSLARDLVLPLWKSNVSVTLMIGKKAKRSAYRWASRLSCTSIAPGCRINALSLRLFRDDVTVAAREAGTKKRFKASAMSVATQNEPDNDKDGDVDDDDDYDDDTDAEEQEH